MIPLLLWILSPHFPWQDGGAQELTAAILFVLASITDGLDGYLARRRGQITTMGMLLDPLADKIMVAGAMIALVAYNPEVVKVWIAVVIIAREFLISGLRSIAASEGFTIQASDLGKLMWLRFKLELALPQGFAVAPGIMTVPRICSNP